MRSIELSRILRYPKGISHSFKSCLQHHVKIVDYGRYKVSTHSWNKLSYVLKWTSELGGRRDSWSLGHSIMRMWISPLPGQWLVAGPGMDILEYTYTVCWNSFIMLVNWVNTHLSKKAMSNNLRWDYMDIGVFHYSQVAKSIPWTVICC